MDIKDRVLKILERHRDEYVSGERIAKETGVSRQYVSRVIAALDSEHVIERRTNTGYMLRTSEDILSGRIISDGVGIKTYVFQSVTSTNDRAKQIYFTEGDCLVVSMEQSGGRKKDGSAFSSPKNAGIYMTIALTLSVPVSSVDTCRKGFAECVGDVLSESTGEKCGVRDTDDIYIGERKVCGILTEWLISPSLSLTEAVFIGIGIYTKDIPGANLSYGSVDAGSTRNSLISTVCSRISAYVRSL